MITRELYLSYIRHYLSDSLIKVIMGQRRTGKSVLLTQVKELYLAHGYKESDIIYINKELPEYQDTIINAQELYDAVHTYKVILIDEIQDISGREKTIRGLFASGGYQIVITGSNSTLLSGELATYLAGRYVPIYVGVYTFNEFCEAHTYTDMQYAWKQYIQHGGAPYFSKGDFSKVTEYHKMLIDTIIIRDISTRYDIRNIHLLQLLLKYIASITGGVTSANSITKYLRQSLTKVSNATISEYIHFLKWSMIINGIYKEDMRGKKILEDQQKLYFTDHGLRNTLVGGLGKDNIAGVLENIVFNHLKIRGWDITVGSSKQEIDFIARKNNRTIYIQVAYTLYNDATRQRELSSLMTIKDNRPKYLISMEEYDVGYKPIEGISYHHIIDFCLGNVIERE